MWIATVDNIDWPSQRGLSTAAQQDELTRILDAAKKLNLNGVVFQVRPHADALYESKLEPWSEYLTGRQGEAPSPKWDPLQFVVEEGHKRGLEVHAWFNPFRAWHPKAISTPARNFIGKTNPGLVKDYGKYKWLDPGEKDAVDRSLEVMLDVVRRYDVDGVHIDDYFYPYKSYAPGKDFPDDASWARYLGSGGTLSRADWRRQNVNGFVERLYRSIKAEKPWVKLGISPFGIYRPGQPPDVKARMDQYEQLYADPMKWLAEGWCDYISPQLYWPIAGDQPYLSLLNWWQASNRKGRHLWPGLATWKVGKDSGDWPVGEIARQIDLTRQSRMATGNIHYSAKALAQDWKGIRTQLLNETYTTPALVPASTWLDRTPPKQPKLRLTPNANGLYVSFDATDRGDVRWWAVYYRIAGKWALRDVVFGTATGQFFTKDLIDRIGLEGIAVSAVDRSGNEGPRYLLRFGAP